MLERGTRDDKLLQFIPEVLEFLCGLQRIIALRRTHGNEKLLVYLSECCDLRFPSLFLAHMQPLQPLLLFLFVERRHRVFILAHKRRMLLGKGAGVQPGRTIWHRLGCGRGKNISYSNARWRYLLTWRGCGRNNVKLY